MPELLLAGIWGYLVGAVPTGVIVSRMLRGVDVRRQGSGHTGGTNVARVAGAWGGVLTIVIDGLLGIIAVIGPRLLADSPWAATVAGVMAVVGHDWSVFIRFGGGIGLAKLTGAMVGADPLRALAVLATVTILWLTLIRLLRFHRARSTILVMALVGPLSWALGSPLTTILLGTLGGLVVIIKTIPDWQRKYE
ncbi:MAG: glycerol-3-phosphate acyltransferase [Anaerolineae bacterium]|nr:glycerol-3-phosphate acyltransferase [Anaerolineae bacterium]